MGYKEDPCGAGGLLEELPHGGLLRIDRPLPFLFVHRSRPDSVDDATPGLLRGEAAALIWRGGLHPDPELGRVVRRIVARGAREFGAFLLLELWAADDPGPAARILGPDVEDPGTVSALKKGLAELRNLDARIGIEVQTGEERGPPGAAPLLDVSECYELGCLLLGLELPRLYLQAPGGRAQANGPARDAPAPIYPAFYRRFRRLLSRALRRAVFEFMRIQTDAHIRNYRVLGPSRVDPAVWRADRELSAIEDSFELLLLVSPVDGGPAWQEFRDGGYERAPEFHYRLLPFDPDILKRRLWDVRLETVDDPTLLFLLRDKREELDRKISLLAERGSPTFRHGSIRLYGPVEDWLEETARNVLAHLPAPAGQAPEDGRVDAAAFSRRAAEEIAAYRAERPDFSPRVQIRPDVTGLMVSRGNLLIGREVRLDPRRVEALVHHELGTHALTFFNGANQRLRLLATGLADYDELQEGIAVLAEYLAGGLTAARLRILAARVLAAAAVERGADFVETFRLLHRDHGFAPGSAFWVATRVHQSGGFTRDLIYLRGLARTLEFVRAGEVLEPLYAGKLAAKHVESVLELVDRGILGPPALLPRILRTEAADRRLRLLREGLPLHRLAEETDP